jgi:FAD/FMN-containing dehydrogenase
MIHSTLKRRDGSPVGDDAIEAFQTEFAGAAIRPGDDRYEDARHIWNASIDRHPGLIARCTGTADVAAAVNFARAQNLLVAIRGGGHNVAGRALCDDGIVIDLSLMKAIHVDPRAQTVRVQGGATLGDLDRETHLHGLAVPTGVVPQTGIAGLTLGGGHGWLSRRLGLTCDSLLGCELVTAQGLVLTVDRQTNADLFWGLRGGGGNFGVVTSFLFQAYPVAHVYGGIIVYPRDEAATVLRNFRNFMLEAPDELSAGAVLTSLPDGTPATIIAACCCADLDRGAAMLEPLRGFATPMFHMVQPMPFPAMQKLAAENMLVDAHNYWKFALLKQLEGALIDRLVEHANAAPSPHSKIVVGGLGGAMGRIARTDTAFPQRDAVFNVGIEAQWTDPADSERNRAWTQAAADELQPYSTGRNMPNFLDEEPDDVVRAAFGENYDRLSDIKAKYDPTNFFSVNLNIQPRRRMRRAAS